MTRLDRPTTLLLLALSCLLAAASASATTYTYQVVGGGLDDGHACLSSTGSGQCAAQALFSVGGSYPIYGHFTYDDVTSLIDIDITLTSGSLSGSYDGVTDVVFSSVHYVVDDMGVALAFGNQLYGSAATGTVSGSYEQLDSGSSVVGASGFGPVSPVFSSFSCSNLDAVGLCGLTVGASRDLSLDVGTTGSGDPFDFVHTFNFNVVVPEPATGSLLGFGLGVLGIAKRRR